MEYIQGKFVSLNLPNDIYYYFETNNGYSGFVSTLPIDAPFYSDLKRPFIMKGNQVKWHTDYDSLRQYTIWGDYIFPECNEYDCYVGYNSFFDETVSFCDGDYRYEFHRDGTVDCHEEHRDWNSSSWSDRVVNEYKGTYLRQGELLKIIEKPNSKKDQSVYLVYDGIVCDGAMIREEHYSRIADFLTITP